MHTPIRTLIPATCAALLAISGPASAAGSSSSSTRTQPDDTYERAVRAVESEDYERARDLLNRVVREDRRNADAWNWLGYSNRKLGNYDQSLAAYERALAIDPEHRGALEYLGELYLQTGEPAKAKEQLRRLDDACGMLGCEEYDELEEAIAKHESG